MAKFAPKSRRGSHSVFVLAALLALLQLSAGQLKAAQETAKEAAKEAAKETDPATGLLVADNWQLVKAHCGACHSYRLVTANRGNREYWLNTLRWMQRTQNLWPIPEQQESDLLDYLASNYNESEWGRRPPLSPALLPTPALARAKAATAAP